MGGKGEVANVSDGYARNYLFPRKMAEMATAGQIAQVRKIMEQKADHARREARARRRDPRHCWRKTVLTIPAPVGGGEKLFGSITNADIATAIYAARKIRVDKRNVDLEEPIKMVGTYMVKVDVNGSPEPAEVKVIVVPEEHKACVQGGGCRDGGGKRRPRRRAGGDYSLPQNLDAELSVLGASMLTPNVIPAVSEIVRPHYFYRPGHQRIFEVIEDLFSRGEPVDPITVSEQLANRASLEAIGGRAFIHGLVTSVPAATNARYYAEIVRENYYLRSLIKVGGEITEMGYRREQPPLELIDRAEQMVFDISQSRVQGSSSR